MSRMLSSMVIPGGLMIAYANLSDYYSIGFTNALNLAFDWLGLTFAAAVLIAKFIK